MNWGSLCNFEVSPGYFVLLMMTMMMMMMMIMEIMMVVMMVVMMMTAMMMMRKTTLGWLAEAASSMLGNASLSLSGGIALVDFLR